MTRMGPAAGAATPALARWQRWRWCCCGVRGGNKNKKCGRQSAARYFPNPPG
jgi:hypothetical protein